VSGTYIVPWEELEVEDLKEKRKEALALLEEEIRAVGKSPEDFIFRDILPKTDLGLTNEEWKISYTAAYTEEKKVDVTLPGNKFIVFYGYTNNSADPKTLYVKWFDGAVPIAVVQVEKLYSYANPIGYYDPFVFREEKVLRIYFYGKAAGDDWPVLRGIVAELPKKVVTPPE